MFVWERGTFRNLKATETESVEKEHQCEQWLDIYLLVVQQLLITTHSRRTIARSIETTETHAHMCIVFVAPSISPWPFVG